MTPEQLAEAKQYGRYSLACTLADKGLDLLFLTFAAVVLARPLDAWLQGVSLLNEVASLRLVAFFLLVTLLHICVSLPLSFYSSFLLEHRFKLSTLTVAGWVRRYLLQNGLALGLGAALSLGLYWLIWTTQGWWWLTAAGAFFCVTIILGRVVPVLIMPLFHTTERLDAPELAERMNALAAGTGLTIAGVYRIALSEETVKANAMLAGLGLAATALGRHALEPFLARGNRGGLRPRGRASRLPPRPQDDSAGPRAQRGRVLGLRPLVAVVGRPRRATAGLCHAADLVSALDHAHSVRFRHAPGAAAERHQPAA